MYIYSINLKAVHRDIKPENMLLSRVVSQNNAGPSGNQSKRYRGHSVELVSRDNRCNSNEINSKD
jgi:serine/threonine protein kinase